MTSTAPHELLVPRRASGRTAQLELVHHSSGERASTIVTEVSLSYDENALHVRFSNLNDSVQTNSYTEHNSTLWKQSVVEVFIAPSLAPSLADDAPAPTRYLEVEISPQDVLFVAHITNPTRDGKNNHLEPIEHAASGIVHSTFRAPDRWTAELAIPFALVGGCGVGGHGVTQQAFRANFFRIRKRADTEDCTAETCDYLAWKPTFVTPPSFHVSKHFGTLRLG